MINEFRLSWSRIQYFFLATQPGHRDFDPFEKRKYCNTASTRSSFRYQQQWLTIRCRVQYNEYNSIRDTNQSKHTIFRGGTLRVTKAPTWPTTLTKTCREFPSAFYICSVIARANPYRHGKFWESRDRQSDVSRRCHWWRTTLRTTPTDVAGSTEGWLINISPREVINTIMLRNWYRLMPLARMWHVAVP